MVSKAAGAVYDIIHQLCQHRPPGMLTDLSPCSSNSDNPVQQAYVATLESQITTLREENAGLYKIQAQNSQRLVHLNEQLRSSEDTHRQEHTELVHLRSERNAREREREEAVQLRKEKDRNIETLQDELSMMKLEFEMLEKTNEALKEDNSSLLRRWLEKKAQEAAEMDKMVTEATGKLNISDGNK